MVQRGGGGINSVSQQNSDCFGIKIIELLSRLFEGVGRISASCSFKISYLHLDVCKYKQS
jgi:hypothetical protein